MLDTRGFIAETNATHLFFVSGGVVATPTTAACPGGITRSAILDLCRTHGIPHEVRDITLAEAFRADEVFCTGTMGELAVVDSIDGRQIGGSGSGESMTNRLGTLFRGMVDTESESVML